MATKYLKVFMHYAIGCFGHKLADGSTMPDKHDVETVKLH